MSDDILKQLVLGDDLAKEFGNFNFSNLGFSLSEFEVDEKRKKGSKKDGKKPEKQEEITKYKHRLGKRKSINNKNLDLTVSNLIQPKKENLEITNQDFFKKENFDKKEPTKNKLGYFPETSIKKNNNSIYDNSTLTQNNFGNSIVEEFQGFGFYQQPKKIPQEKDLDLKLLCIHDGEKIYQLSDLFVPKDEKIIRKIERYNNKIMSISEKDKYDKDSEGQKKEVNETEEIKQIIKKAKRNQKFTKINITYDEKFFDKTHFLENIHASTLAHQEVLLENKEQIKKQILQEGLLKSFRISNDKKIDDDIIERNLLNSLFYVKVKLNENNHLEENYIKNDIEERELLEEYLFYRRNINDSHNKKEMIENKNYINYQGKFIKEKSFELEKIIEYNNIKNGYLEVNKKIKEDNNELLSCKNTNISDLTYSSFGNLSKKILPEKITIDPSEYDEIIQVNSNSPKNKNNQTDNFDSKLKEEETKQSIFSNKISPNEDILIKSSKKKNSIDDSVFQRMQKSSFEESEILKLNLLIQVNVEKNMKLNPEDVKNDKYLIIDKNNYGNNAIINNEKKTKENNYDIRHINQNEIGEDNQNNLMDVDYLNDNNNFINSNLNIKMEMDFENINNFSFQNRINLKDNNMNSSGNNEKSKFCSLADNSLNIANIRSTTPIKNQNTNSNANKITNFSTNDISNNDLDNKNFETSKTQNNNKNTNLNSSSKKRKHTNSSNEEYNENDYDDYDEENDENEDDEDTENADEKDIYPPEDIFETKEFKLFNLKDSDLLKAAIENNIKEKENDESIENINQIDDLNNYNKIPSQKGLDFEFNKPFPNANKEKNFLLLQNEENTIKKPLKSLSANDGISENKNDLNIFSSHNYLNHPINNNNLNDLRDLNQRISSYQKENKIESASNIKTENEFLGLKKERDIADYYDLFDKSKCQKYKQQAFYNEYLLTGEYLPAILLSEEDINSTTHKFFEILKKIYDLNDYNMNFEILKNESLFGNRKDKDKEKEGKDHMDGKDTEEKKESLNTITIDLGTGLPQTKAEIFLRDAELITEPLPILPLNEEIPKHNLLILGLNNTNKNESTNNDLITKNEINTNKDLNIINSNNNVNIPSTFSSEDFFSNLQSKINTNLQNNSNQNFLKIGKAKGNLLTHAKCGYNLTYNKINLTYDDLRDFHRPNFCKYLLREKKKKNFSFMISEKYNISKGDKIKRWDCAILTRNFLKKQEKKRISKNIQYMNAYEIFKDRHKLSLNDGKYALFEHIDEYPLFVSNFGMASKLKKFLYTPKLFNVNVANPNTKLNDVELKTYNITGPYGSQILLQPNQKLPLVGQIDLNELKGMSVLDNKMYRSPVFYDKFKNPISLNSKSVKNVSDKILNEDENNENKNHEIHNITGKNKKVMNNTSNTNLTTQNSLGEKTHSHHTRRRNVLSININNNQKEKINSTINNKNNQNNSDNIIKINTSEGLINSSETNYNSNQKKNLISIGNNVMLDPSKIQVVEKDGKKYYNFLLTFRKSKEGKESFTIREIEHNYVVAQEEPKIEVYPPQSRQYNNFLKKKIQTYTYKLYDEIGYKRGINFKEFTNLFPNVTEQILKKNFREMNIEIDKNICFFSKIPSEDNHMLITPENICQFESCQFGIYKLREVGIKNLTNPDKISYATNKFINQTADPKQQFLARVTEEELLTTPWNITQNFLQAKQIKGMLAIKGIGDPSNGQGGYSFLKMPVKNYNDNKTLKEEIDILKNANKNIKTVTGTDADLRKLSKDDIKMKLIQLGQDEEIINKLSRWERVSLLRFRSSQAAQMVNIIFF